MQFIISPTASPRAGVVTDHEGVPVGTVTNPASVLTRPNDTTAYAQNDLVASSTTAGSVVVPSFTATRSAGGPVSLAGVRLHSNHTTGLADITFRVELWSAAPTFTNGDNGAYAVATGAASFVGRFDVTMVQAADGAYGIGAPPSGDGTFRAIRLASGSSIYWSLKVTHASGFTPQASKTFTLVPELMQN